MMTARFVAGAFLFALLIVDICCVPLQKGPGNQGGGGGGGAHGGGADAGNYGGGGGGGLGRPAVPVMAVVPSGAAQGGGAGGAGAAGPAGGLAAGAYAAGGAGAGPGFVVAGSAPGAGYQPAEDISWAVAPDMTSGAPGVGPGGVASGQQRGPSYPAPTWQGGELSHSEYAFEHGDYKYETEEQGSPVFPPYGAQPGAGGPGGAAGVGGAAGTGGIIVAAPGLGGEGAGGFYPGYPNPGPWPYPSFDWRFLTGQYPPGTVSYGSSDYEEGTDRWREAQFVKYLATLNKPSDPVKGGKGGKGVAAGGGGGARGGFRQPGVITQKG